MMKYSNEIIIKKPLSEFIEKMENLENMKHWQKGFDRYETIEGTPGEKGTKMKMYYSKPKMELVETIIKREMPHEFHASYDTNGMQMINHNYFTATDDGHTKWVSETEAVTTNFFYKALMFLVPGMFKKNSVKLMKALKAFVEDGTSVMDS